MKKAIFKTACVLALLCGMVVAALCHGFMAFFAAFILAYGGLLGLLGKDRILNY